jgi:peptidoglycan hydrolase-like protein with peptidoglycan-binding domain
MALILGPVPPYVQNTLGTMILQKRLNNIDAYRIAHGLYPQWGGHVIDGIYDIATCMNVGAFQGIANITQDGIYGPQTELALQLFEAVYGIHL